MLSVKEMALFDTIQQHAAVMPDQAALKDGLGNALSYQDLLFEIERALQTLQTSAASTTIALAMDNHLAWAVLDIATMVNQTSLVPIPTFFSTEQTLHAVNNAGASVLITDNPERYRNMLSHHVVQTSTFTTAGKRLMLMTLDIAHRTLPKSTVKITYTSGTTGQPKGVCLSEKTMLCVAKSIAKAAKLKANSQHLCVLPLSTLLENVAGLYATLIAGGTAHIMPCAQVGLNGSSLDIQQLLRAIDQTQANTAILIPEMLSTLVTACEAHAHKLPSLHFLAVGGASVSPDVLKRAKQLGLPIFEGYGLSESTSVVSLNTAAANKIGSVGKPLPHIEIKVSDQHEIFVRGANYLGYVDQDTETQEWLATGDIGYLDAEGYLFISGRKKNIFITSFGRNVSPEWVERDLTNAPEIMQACLFGEARPWNTALIVAAPKITTDTINATINEINQKLPDYARVSKWLLADEPFTVNNNQLTPNGRLKRDMIWQQYQQSINAMY